MIATCYRHPRSARRRDGVCAACMKNWQAFRRRRDGEIKPPVDALPDAACSLETDETSLVLVGEVTASAWDGVADALALRMDEPLVVLDLRRVSHARSRPSRVASYVEAMGQRGVRVVVAASRYVRACVQASRYGAELDVEWVAP